MKNKLKIFCVFALILLLIAPLVLCVNANGDGIQEAQEYIDSIINSELQRYSSNSIQDFIDVRLSENAGISSEWYILALAQYKSYDFSSYRVALKKYLSDNEISSASTREKYALALASIGADRESIEELLTSSLGKQGIMSWVFGLHILNNGYSSNEYDIVYVKEKILSLQLENGSWSVMGKNGEVDTTAMAIQALSPYYSEKDVEDSINKALNYISESQLSNGEFQQYGLSNSESVSQVIIALSCLGIDCQNDDRFIKNGKTLFDVLNNYKTSNGGYSHIADGEYNQMATVQALCAMVAYIQKDETEPNFYIYKKENHEFENETLSQNVSEKVIDDEMTSETKCDYKTILVICILFFALSVCTIMFILKKRNLQNHLLIIVLTVIAIVFVVFTNFQSVEEHYSVDTSKSTSNGSVRISIKCDVLKDFEDNSVVPDNCIILEETKVDLCEGDTVYDVLMKVVSENKIHIETNGSVENTYVEGIANIYEFDFGDLSGWVYQVNGVSASVSCGSYELHHGDIIEWSYSLCLGEDVAS